LPRSVLLGLHQCGGRVRELPGRDRCLTVSVAVDLCCRRRLLSQVSSCRDVKLTTHFHVVVMPWLYGALPHSPMFMVWCFIKQGTSGTVYLTPALKRLTRYVQPVRQFHVRCTY